MADSSDHRMGAVQGMQFGHDVRQVVLHGALRYVQMDADEPVGEAHGHQAQDLLFSPATCSYSQVTSLL